MTSYLSLLYDPSTFILIFLALGSILFGVRQSTSTTSLKKYLPKDLNDKKEYIKSRQAIFLPLFGSLFLVLLFFTIQYLYYVIFAILILYSFFSLFWVFTPAVSSLLKFLGHPPTKIFKFFRWNMSVLSALTTFASVGVTVAWIVEKSWTLSNCIAICLAISCLSFIRLPNLKVSVILLGLFFIYDVFWVFLSAIFFGESVMLKVATGLVREDGYTLPAVLTVPRIYSGGFGLLGLGDIILPGIFLCFLHHFDLLLSHNNTHTPVAQPGSGDKEVVIVEIPTSVRAKINNETINFTYISSDQTKHISFFALGFIGYIFGLLLTIVMVVVMERGQPALLYLVPFIIIPPIIYAKQSSVLNVMWRGISEQPVSNVSSSTLPSDSVY